MEFLGALFGIMMVNIVLSGDNAVVIAMASRSLPPKQQKMAILWGSAGAIGLRVVLTLVAVIVVTTNDPGMTIVIEMMLGLLEIGDDARVMLQSDVSDADFRSVTWKMFLEMCDTVNGKQIDQKDAFKDRISTNVYFDKR